MRSVLVVDDSAAFRRQVRRMLEAGNYNVVAEAATGTEAIEAAILTDPSLALVDVGLPDMSGFDVALRIDPSRVVLISGRDPRTFATALSASGVLGFLAKEDLSLTALEAIAPAA